MQTYTVAETSCICEQTAFATVVCEALFGTFSFSFSWRCLMMSTSLSSGKRALYCVQRLPNCVIRRSGRVIFFPSSFPTRIVFVKMSKVTVIEGAPSFSSLSFVPQKTAYTSVAPCVAFLKCPMPARPCTHAWDLHYKTPRQAGTIRKQNRLTVCASLQCC